MSKNNVTKRKNKKRRAIAKKRKKIQERLLALSDIKIYLDESGASGVNFVDEEMPFFVQAGVVVSANKVKKLEKAIEDWELRYKKTNQKEIKSDIFKKDKGFVLFSELFHEIKNLIICPTYAFVDKKFAICFTLVESLLDFDYNSRITESEYYNQSLKDHWAETLYQLIPDVLLSKFNTSRGKDPSIESFKASLDALCVVLKNNNENNLADLLSSSDLNYAYNFYSSGENRKKASVNLLVFRNHYHKIRDEMYRSKVLKAELVHDEQVHYEGEYRDFFKLVEKEKFWLFKVADDDYVKFGGFNEVSLRFSSSLSEPILRLSDLICGYMRYSLLSIRQGSNDLSIYAGSLFHFFWTPILRHHGQVDGSRLPKWYYEGMVSKEHRELVEMLFAQFKKSK